MTPDHSSFRALCRQHCADNVIKDLVPIQFVFVESADMSPVMEMLEGHVFHVTKKKFLPAIQAEGALLPNNGGERPSTFGFRSNSFFLKRNCVSLFDYRTIPEDPHYRRLCWPLQAAHPGGEGIAILFLEPAIHGRLELWTKWQEEGPLSDIVVPYVEAGYPGALSLAHIDRVVLVDIQEDPNCLAAIVRDAREKAGR